MRLREPLRGFFKSGIVDNAFGLGERQKRGKFRCRLTPVERGQHKAALLAGKQRHEKLCAIVADDGHAVAGLEPHFGKAARNALSTRIDVSEGKLRSCFNIDKGTFMRR